MLTWNYHNNKMFKQRHADNLLSGVLHSCLRWPPTAFPRNPLLALLTGGPWLVVAPACLFSVPFLHTPTTLASFWFNLHFPPQTWHVVHHLHHLAEMFFLKLSPHGWLFLTFQVLPQMSPTKTTLILTTFLIASPSNSFFIPLSTMFISLIALTKI